MPKMQTGQDGGYKDFDRWPTGTFLKQKQRARSLNVLRLLISQSIWVGTAMSSRQCCVSKGTIKTQNNLALTADSPHIARNWGWLILINIHKVTTPGIVQLSCIEYLSSYSNFIPSQSVQLSQSIVLSFLQTFYTTLYCYQP